MENATFGFYVLGFIAGALILLAVVLTNGKRSLEQKECDKHSVAKS